MKIEDAVWQHLTFSFFFCVPAHSNWSSSICNTLLAIKKAYYILPEPQNVDKIASSFNF